MSGGAFDYNQYRIREVYLEIEKVIKEQGTFDEWGDPRPTFSKPVLKELLNGVKALKLAEVYTQRVDYLFEGDDGEESFLERLKEELEVLK
jgi:hypothetical protein